jgi:hypothetical protein
MNYLFSTLFKQYFINAMFCVERFQTKLLELLPFFLTISANDVQQIRLVLDIICCFFG